jgi:translation initiation factor IF-2
MASKKKDSVILPRPPIVAVLGHVDHGKTTLLDTIRKSNVASHEHGGITQHIGAYQVTLGEGKIITFIDTPGHEAFAKMRSRGATTADIAILVVAADDSVMPQTKESIVQIKNAGIPFIVACNKSDLPAANPEKVKQDLAKNGIQVEGFGGDIPFVQISAKTGSGIPALIDNIILVLSLKGLTSEPDVPVEASVVETKIDKGKGLVATVIIKKGTLSAGTSLYDFDIPVVKVRAMFDEYGKPVKSASPSRPVEILGFTKLPTVGDILSQNPQARKNMAVKPKKLSDQLPDFLKPIDANESRNLNIVLKADTAGSLEAVINSLDSRITVVSGTLGTVSEADVLLAKSCKAVLIGFNVKVPGEIEKLAFAEKVVVRSYSIIYELLEELEEVVSGMQEVLTVEREMGKAAVIGEFPFNDQKVAGIKVISGRIARGDSVKIMSGEKEISVAKIKSMRHQKDEINKAEIGYECGIIFDKKVDFSVGDVIIAFTKI